MLQVVPFENLHELDDLNFVRDKKSKIIVICPNPHQADIYQKIFNSRGETIRVCTISRFLSENLSDKFGESFFDQYVSKADLFLKLAVIWKNKFPAQSYENYIQTFNLLTELRSFTVHDRILLEALNNINPQIKLAIDYFNFTINKLELVDEHQAYFKLCEAYRTENFQHEDDENVSLVFWGFHQMTALQIDFLKAASIRHDIYVPFPASVYLSSISGDWIRWISPVLNIESKHSLYELKLRTFPSGKLCETLKAYLKNNSDMATDFYLTTKNPTLDQFCEVPIKQMLFKSVNNVFADDISFIYQEVLNHIDCGNGVVDCKDLIAYLNQLLTQSTGLNDRNKNFRRFKTLLLFKASCDKWFNLSENNQKLTIFDLKTIYKYINLCLPRTYSLPLMERPVSLGFGLESIAGFDPNKRNIICATSDYVDLKKSDGFYDENLYEFLSAIGPIKRSQLDFEINRFYLREILKQDKNILFLEAGLLEKSIAWKEILSDFVFQEAGSDATYESTSLAINSSQAFLNDYVVSKKIVKLNLSPSGLQKWLDCPRKYHFLIEQRIDNQPVLLTEISPADLGALEHKLIEKIIKSRKDHTSDEIKDVARTELEKFILNKHLNINTLRTESYLKEITKYASNGVRILNEFQKKFYVNEYLFEQSIFHEKENAILRGRVDVLAVTPTGHFIIDFKRSPGGVAGLYDVKNFEQIQLPFYLSHIDKRQSMLFAGYVCLSEITESNFLCFNQDSLDGLIELELVSPRNAAKHLLDFSKWIAQYDQIEQEEVEKILNEEVYPPHPRKTDVCQFCIIKNICTRG